MSSPVRRSPNVPRETFPVLHLTDLGLDRAREQADEAERSAQSTAYALAHARRPRCLPFWLEHLIGCVLSLGLAASVVYALAYIERHHAR